MGYIKKLKNNELVGGTDKTTIYPVTSTKAIFEEVSDNEFKSQKYLNNHITGNRIENNTISGDKLVDKTVTEEKVSDALMDKINSAAHGVTEEFETEVREALKKVVNTVSVNNGTPIQPVNKNINITVPENLAELNTDEDHRTVTDAEKTTWSGKADKSEMSVVAGTGADADKTTITLKSGTSATVLTQHQDVSEFIKEGEVFGTGDDSTASFNPYADTVWNKQQTLSEIQKQQIRNNIGVSVADNEDIQSVNGILKFADRAYTATTSSVQGNMGYKILRKGSTFASQVTATNTIYEIRYDYDLNAQTVTLPTNCVLNFNGGSVKNGDLVGNVSCISSDKTTIFDDVTISGTWNNSVSYAEWFNFDGVDDSKNVQNLFNFRGNIELQANVVYVIKSILFPNSSTNVKGSLRLWSNSFLEGNGATLKLADNVLADKNTNMITPEDNINNLTINNVIFDGNSANNIFDFSTSSVARTAMFIRFGGANNVVITNSKFLNCAGRNDIVVSMTWSDETKHNDAGDNIHIKDCVFRSGGAYISNGQLNANQNDFSFILSEASHTIVEGCFFVECDLDTTDVIGGVDYDTRKSYNINCGGYELHGDFSSSLNNTFIGCRPAIFICTQKEHELKNLVVCGNFIDCKEGINFYNIRDGSYNNCDISQNVIKATTFGIYAGLNGSYNVPIKNVKIRNNSIYSNISLQFNEINDSEISFNNITADYVGIFLYGAPMEQENLTINNNMITILNANISHTSSGAYTIEKAGIYKREISHLETGGYYPLYNFNVVDNKFIFVNSEDSEGDSVGTGISMLDLFSNVARHFNTKAVTITGNSVLNGDVSDNTIRSAALKSYFDINYTNNSRMEIRYHVGTFADKPTVKNIYEGYRYFCTDKQTTEGATNGIEIIYKGSGVWVDALGRVVS